MRLQWAFATVPALDFGGAKLWGVVIAENVGILLQAPSSTSRWPESVGTQRIPMWSCSTTPGSTALRHYRPVPVLYSSPRRARQLVSHWGVIHFKESFLPLWKKHPCKAEGLLCIYPGQCRTNSGEDKEGLLEDGAKDGLVWPEEGLGRPFHKINAIYFLLLDFLVPDFSFTMSQKRPEY